MKNEENRKIGALKLLNKNHNILILLGEYHAEMIPKGSSFKLEDGNIIIRGKRNMTIKIHHMTDVKLWFNNDESILFEEWDLSFLKPKKELIGNAIMWNLQIQHIRNKKRRLTQTILRKKKRAVKIEKQMPSIHWKSVWRLNTWLFQNSVKEWKQVS